ncbi:MAG: putative porin [Rikenellaceae bacterium]|nr:putative porin [Rikenellaceae bacterium]
MPGRVHAGAEQMPPAGLYGDGMNGMPLDTARNRGAGDSTKVRKPLESYFFNDSIRGLSNFSWNVDMSRNRINFAPIDTSMNGFQVDYPFLQNDVGSAYIGTLGGAAIPLNYFLRPNPRNFTFASAYDCYLYTPERVPFYNVKAPFTQGTYFMSGQRKKAEEYLGLIHAQNISPSTGFNLNYKSRGTRGMYTWQGARDKNLSLAFSHTGKKYSAHAGYIYNAAILKENGGIANDRDITDTIFDLPENIPIRLQDARNTIKNNTFYFIQSYGVPLRKLSDEDFSIADRSSIFFGHSFEWSKFTRLYTDTRSSSGDYYDHWYIDPAASRDSTYEGLLSNKLFVQIQPWDRNAVIGTIDAGIGMDNHWYYQFRPDEYLNDNTKKTNRNSYYVYGSLEGSFRRYLKWGADLRYHPMGYRSQDIDFGGNIAVSAFIRQRPITLSGSVRYASRTPGYWTENYFSNHYAWFNSFAKENETRIDLALTVPAIGTELGAYQSVTTGKIYYDANCRPAQHAGSVSVSGLYARKDFRFGGFHLNHRVLLQWSTAQEVVPVPLASAYLSYYFEFNVVKNVLRVQLGVDGRYNTEYYAFGYNPALAQFYNQDEKQLGNYVMLDAFLVAKWKRMRIMVKLQHANENLFGERNYFTVLHYPLNMRQLRFGFSWSFYD